MARAPEKPGSPISAVPIGLTVLGDPFPRISRVRTRGIVSPIRSLCVGNVARAASLDGEALEPQYGAFKDSGQKRDPVNLECGSDRYPNGPRPAKLGLVERSDIERGPR